MAHPLTARDCGPLQILARHPALVDFADALVRGLGDGDAAPIAWCADAGPITVHVGVRELFGVLPPRKGLRIGIQTEQFYDHAGKALWGQESRLRLIKYLACYDVLLDLSEANRPHYAALPTWAQRRVHVGPWIFPRHPVGFRAGTDTRTVFFGTVNDRRRDVIAALEPPPFVVATHTYGAALAEAAAPFSAILNIHYSGGTYAEFPRLLLAYLAGKPVMSEALGPPFEIGREVLVLGPVPREAERRAVYDAFWNRIAGRYRFVDFLARIGACEPVPGGFVAGEP